MAGPHRYRTLNRITTFLVVAPLVLYCDPRIVHLPLAVWEDVFYKWQWNVPPVVAADDPTFRVAFGNGSGMEGYSILIVEGDGRCQALHGAPLDRSGEYSGEWALYEYRIEPGRAARLKAEVEHRGILRLPSKFIHPRRADGWQKFVKVWIDGRRKSVYCSNLTCATLELFESEGDRLRPPPGLLPIRTGITHQEYPAEAKRILRGWETGFE